MKRILCTLVSAVIGLTAQPSLAIAQEFDLYYEGNFGVSDSNGLSWSVTPENAEGPYSLPVTLFSESEACTTLIWTLLQNDTLPWNPSWKENNNLPSLSIGSPIPIPVCVKVGEATIARPPDIVTPPLVETPPEWGTLVLTSTLRPGDGLPVRTCWPVPNSEGWIGPTLLLLSTFVTCLRLKPSL